MAAASVSLVLAACSLPVRIPIAVVGIPVIYVVDQQQQIRAGLTNARDWIATAPARLRRSECGGGECVAVRDVESVIDAARNTLRQAFPSDAVPLLDAIDRELVAEAETLGAPKPITGVQAAKSGGPQLGYDAVAVVNAFRRMVGIIDRFLSINDLVLTLDVLSNPNDATFNMQIPTNESTQRGVTTNGKMPNVWRGFYTATVTKRGFKDAATKVDLINGSPREVSCTLVPLSSPRDSVCHVQ